MSLDMAAIDELIDLVGRYPELQSAPKEQPLDLRVTTVVTDTLSEEGLRDLCSLMDPVETVHVPVAASSIFDLPYLSMEKIVNIQKWINISPFFDHGSDPNYGGNVADPEVPLETIEDTSSLSETVRSDARGPQAVAVAEPMDDDDDDSSVSLVNIDGKLDFSVLPNCDINMQKKFDRLFKQQAAYLEMINNGNQKNVTDEAQLDLEESQDADCE